MERFDILGLQYFTDGGELLGGGQLNFYETGTTTRKNTFSDAAMTIANTNPVTLDADGRAPNIFFAGLAKCVLTDADGVILETRDPVGDDSADSNGFPAWAADVTYSFNQPVSASDGYIYTSLVNNNLGNDPVSSPTDWQLLAKTIGFDDANNGYVYVVDTSDPLKINAVPKTSISSMQLVSSATAAASATIDFTSLDLSTYNYRFVFENVLPVTDSVGFYLRTSTNNGSTFDSGASDYSSFYFIDAATGALLGTHIPLSGTTVVRNSAAIGVSGEMFLVKAAGSVYSMIRSGVVGIGTSASLATCGGWRASTTAPNAVRFYMSSGDIATGTIRMYRESKA